MGDSRLIGVYLSAGNSRRMGSNKLNLPVGDTFLGSLAFQSALESKLKLTIAITQEGDVKDWVAPFLNQKNYRVMECENAYKGQSFSLQAGIKAADEAGAAGAVVLLGDQPLVSPSMINRLIEEFLASPTVPFIAYLHRGIPKPPVLLARSLFPAIYKLEGDQGARALLSGQEKAIELLDEDDVYFYDVDTKADYQFLLKNWELLRERKG